MTPNVRRALSLRALQLPRALVQKTLARTQLEWLDFAIKRVAIYEGCRPKPEPIARLLMAESGTPQTVFGPAAIASAM
jgi:hypothetical protein